MADKDFVVKNGLSVNSALHANSTVLTYNSQLAINSISTVFTTNSVSFNANLSCNGSVAVTNNVTVNNNLTVSNTLTVNNTLAVSRGLQDGLSSLGSAGQVLLSNGSGIYWANTAGLIIANNSTSDTFYFPMSNSSSNGLWTSATIIPTKIYFSANTGTLSATNFNSLSDKTLKTNIKQIENPLQKLSSVEGVSFEWKDTNRPSYGVIAQQIETPLPELVSTREDGIKSVNYDGFIAILLESIKVLEKRIEDLENKYK